MTVKQKNETKDRRREQLEASRQVLRPQLWEKLTLGLAIPKDWEQLFDIEEEQDALDKATEDGLI